MTFQDEFGRLERLLHRLAFHLRLPQAMVADIEDTMFASTMSRIEVDRPVFISGLPRSGTTILLYLLADSGHFATHTYQDMPFVLCPMLWNKFSRRFAVERQPRERAHADGLKISSDSPEAFEEMVWKYFWRDHYRSDRIELWTMDQQNDEFDRFFLNHMTKIIAIRQRDAGQDLRYVSKNNVNIARLGALPGPLRHGTFIIPFRDPVQHAASMLRQHRRFSRLQAESGFARRYMEAIGHHDFGMGLRPIDFGNWLEHAGSPDEIEFWVRYWIAAYRHVLECAGPGAHLVCNEQLTSNPEGTLRRLADVVDVPPDDLLAQAGRLRPVRTHEIGSHHISQSVRNEAERVFRALGAHVE